MRKSKRITRKKKSKSVKKSVNKRVKKSVNKRVKKSVNKRVLFGMGMSPEICPICSEQMDSPYSSGCVYGRHNFHKDCLSAWYNMGPGHHTCPICRQVIPNPNPPPIIHRLLPPPPPPSMSRGGIGVNIQAYRDMLSRQYPNLENSISRASVRQLQNILPVIYARRGVPLSEAEMRTSLNRR